MSFFDKLFSHRSSNSTSRHEVDVRGKSSRSSDLYLTKDQIRFILFRECDRRGRKLLFDSNAVEKAPLPDQGGVTMCNQKYQSIKKNFDFIETTSTHGYKYKKLSNDVACLGEMIFGSVAMIYKGENSCKIHKIPLPKQLMFTTIVHAPIRCHASTVSERSLGSSSGSINESVQGQRETSSSDSKLYTHEGIVYRCSSTYPCIRTDPSASKVTECCVDVGDVDSCLIRKVVDERTLGPYENAIPLLGTGRDVSCPLEKWNLESGNWDRTAFGFNLPQKSSDSDRTSSGTLDSPAVKSYSSSDSDNFSSVSGSLSSLRRRWAQSCATSLDLTGQVNTNSSNSRKRTKLGMALILDLSNSRSDGLENFLFNHTIIIDSIMSKLQSSVELAYIKNQNFVDLIHTAFTDAQESIYDIVNAGARYTVPVWMALTENLNDGAGRTDSMDPSVGPQTGEKEPFDSGWTDDETTNSCKLKFLDEFCYVLERFDTKDTNFFVSTLLTAVLTHHLSWVTAIAETDVFNRHDKVQSVIQNYNPIWAQLNDLYGLLGSPLKCAKTIVTGSESKRSHIAVILDVLTYFVRCYNVIENTYDVNIEDVIGHVEEIFMDGSAGFDWDFDGEPTGGDRLGTGDESSADQRRNQEPGRGTLEVVGETSADTLTESLANQLTVAEGFPNSGKRKLKRNKSYMSQLGFGNGRHNCPPAGGDFAFVDPLTNVPECLSGSSAVSGKGKSPRTQSTMDEYMSPDEGYDTIDSSRTEPIFGAVMNHHHRVSRVPDSGTENIVFVLGENEPLSNLQKRVVLTKSDVIEMEREDFQVLPVGGEGQDVSAEMPGRTFGRSDDSRTGQHGDEVDQVPWLVREFELPRANKPSGRKILDVSAVFGGVNTKYNPEQVLQGVVGSGESWESTLQKDLFLSAYNSIIEKDVSEALCIVGNVDVWEVSVRSSRTSALDRGKNAGVRVGMSQLVADMLESFLCLRKINLSPNFCLLHIEKKLREIYLKSKTVAELLNSTDLCTIEYLTTRLDVGINDIPLLLSVATTHSPDISKKYGLSFT